MCFIRKYFIPCGLVGGKGRGIDRLLGQDPEAFSGGWTGPGDGRAPVFPTLVVYQTCQGILGQEFPQNLGAEAGKGKKVQGLGVCVKW